MSSTQTHLELNKSECLKDTIPKGKVSKSIGLIFIFLRVQHIIVTLHTVHEGCVLQLMKTCIYIYTYVHMSMYIYMQTKTHIYICIRTYVRTFIHACIHSLIHSLIHSFITIHTYIYLKLAYRILTSHPQSSSSAVCTSGTRPKVMELNKTSTLRPYEVHMSCEGSNHTRAHQTCFFGFGFFFSRYFP